MHDTPKPGARPTDVAGLVDARGDQHRIVLGSNVAERDIFADIAVQNELHPALGELVIPLLDDVFFQLEAGNPVDQQPAGTVVAVINRDLKAHAPQPVRSGEAARPGADDPDAFRSFGHRLDLIDPAFLKGHVGQVFLDGANGDGAMAGLFNDAIAFTKPVLWADAPTDLGEGVCRLRGLISFPQPAFRRQLQPVGDVVVQRTMRLTERHPALRAARRLLRRLLNGVLAVDLVEILTAGFGAPLFRRLAPNIDEFQHPLRHVRPSLVLCAFAPWPGCLPESSREGKQKCKLC